MKKWFLFSALVVCTMMVSAGPRSMKAYLSYATFYAPTEGAYIETYLSVLGRSLQFIRNSNGKFQGSVNVTMLFKQNDSIRQFRKYELLSAEIDDTTHINFNLFDQQRILLPSGKYDFELTIADKNSANKPFTSDEIIQISAGSDNIFFSDIEPVESYSKAGESSAMAKSGYDFIPYQDFYYPSSVNRITFYAELYNTGLLGESQPFALSQSIQSLESGKQVEDYFRIKRETSKDVTVVLNEFDISQLPTGNYYLVVEARDKNNNLLANRKMFFQRSNPGVKFNTTTLDNVSLENTFVSALQNPDTLREYIRSIFPIAGANEKLFIKNNTSVAALTTLQQFFLNFWLKRDPANPENAWNIYRQTVLGVESEFGSIYKKGYETDRGRVYLQYGPPNQRISETMNPETFPYEIWQYYKIENQSNIRFVFYTRDKALNDYQLAHSDALGEVKNVNWQYEIKRGIGPRDTDNERYKKAFEEDTWGEHTGEYYNLRK